MDTIKKLFFERNNTNKVENVHSFIEEEESEMEEEEEEEEEEVESESESEESDSEESESEEDKNRVENGVLNRLGQEEDKNRRGAFLTLGGDIVFRNSDGETGSEDDDEWFVEEEEDGDEEMVVEEDGNEGFVEEEDGNEGFVDEEMVEMAEEHMIFENNDDILMEDNTEFTQECQDFDEVFVELKDNGQIVFS